MSYPEPQGGRKILQKESLVNRLGLLLPTKAFKKINYFILFYFIEIIIHSMNVQGPRVDKYTCEESLEFLEGLQANLFQDSCWCQVELHLKPSFYSLLGVHLLICRKEGFSSACSWV